MGGYGERIERPEDIVPAIKRGMNKVKEGVATILEFKTCQEQRFSRRLPPG